MNIQGPNLNSTEITDCSCAICNGPDHDDVGMVGCDNCSQWFHFKCVGVSADVKDISWVCITCKEKPMAAAEGGDKVEPAIQQKGVLKPDTVPAEKSTALEDTGAEVSAVEDLERELERIEEMRNEQMRRFELEKKVHRRRLEVQRELAEQRQKMEREKRQIELEFEKEQLQKAIAEEDAFRKKQQAMRDELQGNLDRLRQRQTGNSLQMKAICAPQSSGKSSAENVATVVQTESSVRPRDYRGAYSKHSTPKRSEEIPAILPRTEQRPAPEINPESDISSDGEQSVPDATPVLQAARPTSAQLSARQFLAKKLPVFTGRPEDWPMFISSYETANEACGFSNVENLARLQECLKGQALEAVRSRLLLPNAVPQIINSLQMLYGRPEQLLNMLLSKVRKAESPKADRLNTRAEGNNNRIRSCVIWAK